MNWRAISFDWNQIRAFLATVEEGNFSAAAKALGSTQPTLSRQISALEAQLGITLFQRGKRFMILTSAGRELVDHVRQMAEAATRVSLAASGQAAEPAGLVTISATGFTAAAVLPDVVRELARQAPLIEVEIIASREVSDLNKREADIAIRHGQPTHPDLIARKLMTDTGSLYAHRDWIAAHGMPASLDDLAGRSFIGFDRPDIVVAGLAERGLVLQAGDIRYRSISGQVVLELARAGLGLTVLTRTLADRYPELVPVLPEAFSVEVPTWLVSHSELRTSNRVRIVFDLIADAFAQMKTGGPKDRPSAKVSAKA
ncbi:LysR family transcriptional regulator [Hyphobacterium sp.]|jgi:DNA-binding transcriptional LysR family regulator|uniref:LysR family transcriptional regulator n=1 Tax=Hyphobacterium sp. TaxID=2004662 RepID=UPI003BABE80D